MFEKITESLSTNEFASALMQKLYEWSAILNDYIAGTDNIRIASIVLILFAFVLFVFLIIIIYVKSMLTFLKSENSSSRSEVIVKENDDSSFKTELEKELERELERELEFSRNEMIFNEQIEKQEKEKTKKKKELEEEKEEAQREEKEEENIKIEKYRPSTKKNNEKSLIDFDWKKGIVENSENTISNFENISLAYHQNNKDLSDLTGLIIDMLARGVDDLKIAQAVTFRNQGKNSEDEVLQLIENIKDFIALCVNKKFSRMEKYKLLPDEATALYHLAEGDTSFALALLENLMDENIDKGMNSPKKDEIFMTTSGYACTFGGLASLNDIHLATGSFELAVELYPQNVNAWNGLGNVYYLAGSKNKAMQAYQNVLNMADEDVYPRLSASANKMLSQYYYDQGNSLQAAKLYNSAKEYYDSIGINRRLDRQEVDAIQIIENNQRKEINNTIQKILANKKLKQYSYSN